MMHRLTGWDGDNAYNLQCFSGNGCPDMDTHKCATCEHDLAVYNRLAAHEDTGLTPEGVTYQTAQLQEWQKKCSIMHTENAALRSQLEQVSKEKDAAVIDLKLLESNTSLCGICRYYESNIADLVCADCKGMPNVIVDNFEWRGTGGGRDG